MSGLKMYLRFADGRDEGSTELPANSADAFTKWYHSGRRGGHPCEVYRGGNTTHINLGATQRHEGWSVFLGGLSNAYGRNHPNAPLPYIDQRHEQGYVERIACLLSAAGLLLVFIVTCAVAYGLGPIFVAAASAGTP
jgi:hypothetical protein